MRCDCHVHIVGDAARYRQIAARTYLAGPAPLDDLRHLGARHGVRRFVLVQPSFYGTDNTLLLDSLDRLGDDGRGVAVVDPGKATPEALDELARRGVRGLRLNLYSSQAGRAVQRLDSAFAALADLAKPMGWHVEVITSREVLVANAVLFERAAVPVVIDHYGLHGDARPESHFGRRLLALMALPHVWIKLSAPYRLASDPMSTRPNEAWLAAIFGRAMGRCVWGSDWPHTPLHALQGDGSVALPYRKLSYGTLIDHFVDAVGSPAVADEIMRDNAARLYGFPASA